MEKKGKGWHGDPEEHRIAGLMGREKTLKVYGEEHYTRCRKKGGAVKAARYNMAEMGRKGGQVSAERKKARIKEAAIQAELEAEQELIAKADYELDPKRFEEAEQARKDARNFKSSFGVLDE